MVLASHAIDELAAQALRDGDIERFLLRRGELIVDLVARFLASHVEHGAPVRPPLSELVIPDDQFGAAG